MTRLILASASPRRREILRALGIDPSVRPAEVDEAPSPAEPPRVTVVRLAREKALDAARRVEEERIERSPIGDSYGRIHPVIRAPGATPGRSSGAPGSIGAAGAARAGDTLVLGADTLVVVGGEALGKPADPADAARMLRLLSGKPHDVLTGLALARPEDGICEAAHAETRVFFSRLTEREIASYVATGEPLDKAGAYGIQDRGAWLVERIEGSYTNVVGLPVELLRELLSRFDLGLEDLTGGG